MTESVNIFPDKEPTQEQVVTYFERAGEKLWKRELRILSGAPFRVAGKEAEEAGWFIGRNATFQGITALKVAELLRFSNEERYLISQAALFTSAMLRNQVEQARKEGKELRDMGSKEREAIDQEGGKFLIADGIDSRAVEIARDAHSPEFYRKLESGMIVPKNATEKRLLKLKKYLLYVHNNVYTEKIQLDSGKVGQKTDIIGWRKRLNVAEAEYTAIGKEKRGDEPHFNIEARLTAQIENELQKEIEALNPKFKLQDNEALWIFLRRSVMQDVTSDTLPRKPRKPFLGF
ncbi:hypothetical protein HY090_00075 [Candidatus Kaiserbacteria bacterium]|nr:hypothetical protein [Candidatus Kaiserbacteria bacterium]